MLSVSVNHILAGARTMCKKSESIKELAVGLTKAQGAFNHAKKDVSNPFFKSKYADLASIIDAAKKPLADNGLSVVQVVDVTEAGIMVLETMLMHVSGEWISGKYPINPVKSDPQSVGSAITYARRYAFSAITGIAADDDDGNAASQQAKTEPKYQQPEQPKAHQGFDYIKLLNGSTCRRDFVENCKKIPAELVEKYTDAMREVGKRFPKIEAVAA